MDEENCSSIFNTLCSIFQKLLSDKSSTAVHITLKEVYQVIQKCSVKFTNHDAISIEYQDMFFSIIQSLVAVLTNSAYPVDSLLLSGTCLSVLVGKLFEPQFASLYISSLYRFVGLKTKEDNKEDNSGGIPNVPLLTKLANDCTHQTKQYPNINPFTQDIDSSKKKAPTFHQIAILHGILSYQGSELFLHRIQNFDSACFLITMFEPIHVACLTPCNSQYHAFTVLVSWLRLCYKHIKELVELSQASLFSSLTDTVNKMLSLLQSNWESPIKGVNTFVKEAYRLLIILSEAERELIEPNNFDLVSYLLQLIMKQSWKIKGKYVVLSIVLQHTNCKEFLEKYPDVPMEVIFNLKANYASTIISEVYKSIVLSIKKCTPSENITTVWSKWWKEPILKSLSTGDKLLIQGVTNIVLPWTLRNIPDSYDVLLTTLEEDENGTSSKLILLHTAKDCGICIVQEKELKILKNYLHHHSVYIRMEIFSIICSSPKKSEALMPEELQLLKEFIDVNLNIDSTPFQQLFLAQLRILSVRIRDSLVQEYRINLKNSVIKLSVPQLEFIDWLVKFSVENTFPGACFQRRRLSLHILNIIFDTFIVSPLGNRRKEKPSKFVEKVIKVAQSQDVWTFFSDDILLNILPCITDFTDEIRSMAFHLLAEFTSWPAVKKEDRIFKVEYIINYAYSLCQHPDYRSNEGGALLLCLVFKKIYIRNNVLSEFECSQAVAFLKDIFKLAEASLCNFNRDLINADPVHGYLLSLQYCISNSRTMLKSFFKFQEEKTLEFVKDLVILCNSTIDGMLSIMKGGDDKSNCPSFCDIGQALEKLIISRKSTSLQNGEFEHGAYSDVSPPEVELLLSCCWHSIKNSCFLLYELSTCICDLDMNMEQKKLFLMGIATKLSNVLIESRHRGVVDACCLVLNKFCCLLLSDEFLHEQICMSLLDSVFATFSNATETSVTRRSAGLPSLIQAVVSSENNNIKRKLLPYTVNKLLDCIGEPLACDQDISDKTDLPQAHAYHILRVLVMESSLSQAIMSHLDSIIPICISGFSSTFWPIQNGALQLFGVLLPRICGQKKVRDEDSEHNLVSAPELFARCPTLKVYLHEQLAKCVESHQKGQLCSELVPVLSVLVKLAPPDHTDNEFVNDFKVLLLELLDIPIWKVRDLVSSALSVMVTPYDVTNAVEEIVQELEARVVNNNKIHGITLVIQKVLKKDEFFPDIMNVMKLLVRLFNILVLQTCSLLPAVLMDSLLQGMKKYRTINPKDIFDALDVANGKDSSKFGNAYLRSRIHLLQLTSAKCCDISRLLKSIPVSEASFSVELFQCLTAKLHSERRTVTFYEYSNLEVWKKIFISLTDYLCPRTHPSVILPTLKFLIDLCSEGKTATSILNSENSKMLENRLHDLLKIKCGLSVTALSFTLLSLSINFTLERNEESPHLTKWNMAFNSHSQQRSPDILRMQAAHSVSILGPNLVHFLGKNIRSDSETSFRLFIGLCEGSLLLLQDEDEEIRSKACEFPSKLPHEYEVKCVQFNIGIKIIFQTMWQHLHKTDLFLPYLWNRLQNYPSAAKIILGIEANEQNAKMKLFEQEYINVFAEPIKLLLEYKVLFIKALCELRSFNDQLWIENLEMFASDLTLELRDLFSALNYREYKGTNLGFAYNHQGFLAFKRLHCQVEAVTSQKAFLPADSILHSTLQKIESKWHRIEEHVTVVTYWFLNQL